MRTFFAATLALSMLAAPAIAAPRDNQGSPQGQHQGQKNDKAQKSDRSKGQHQSRSNDRDRTKSHARSNRNDHRKGDAHARKQNRDRDNNKWSRNNRGSHWTQNNNRRHHDARTQAHRQYSYKGRHYNSVRAPAWHAPRGHDARRVWNRGDRMHSSYRARSYVIDHRAYHLASPPYGYQWVRAGNNVYLVRASNGLVAQIVWNMFY